MVDKKIVDGKVAVLVSPGFGAGWSTWNSPADFAMFDKGLVELAERGAYEKEVEQYLEDSGHDFYTGGWHGITVQYLDQGTKFRIDEYDGSESIEILEDMYFIEA